MAGRSVRTSSRLRGVRRRFDQWRRSRNRGGRIPDELWSAAVGLASEVGVTRTIRELRLDYYALKKRVDAEASVARVSVNSGEEPAIRFVELPPRVEHPSGRCTLELRDESGRALRMEFGGLSVEEIAAVTTRLWSARS